MTKEILLLPRKDESVPLNIHIWKPNENPRAVIHLVHGMAEHMGRYENTARVLCDAGFLVCGHNHRGHGTEWPKDKLGFFAAEKGWDKLILDMHQVMMKVKELYPNLPYVLLGHSMGSFASREFAIRFGKELSALVLSGTGHYPAYLCKTGKAVASLFPKEKPAPFLDKLLFSRNNAPFKPARTPSDWLSRDEERVDDYLRDPYCGFPFTGSAYRFFFEGLAALDKKERLSQMPSSLPVYFLSGDHDPVGQMGRGVRYTAETFREAGMKNVTVRLYPGGRHEMFNEINREEVWHQLIEWLSFLPSA